MPQNRNKLIELFIKKNFPKNRLPPAFKAGGLFGDFSLTGKFFRMFGNDRTLKSAVFNVPDISNLSNSIVHEILEKATKKDELIRHYNSELLNSLNLAKKYRDEVNPPDSELSYKDSVYIKNKITNRVRNELRLRISKGYTNIDLNLIEFLINKYLKETKVVE